MPTLTQAAADIGLTPMILSLPARTLAETATVKNQAKTDVTLQAEVVAWTQDAEGKDIYAETSDLVVTPPVFKVAPGKEQLVRVGRLQRIAAPDAERAYRLILTEVPQQQEAGETVSRTVLRITLPVLVPPKLPSKKSLAVSGGREGDDLWAEVVNPANQNAMVTKIALLQSGVELASKTVNTRVLSGAKRKFVLKGAMAKAASQSPLELAVTLNGKVVQKHPLGISGLQVVPLAVSGG